MKQKQYPPQTGPYFIKVKSEQSTDSWQNFDAVRAQISVGQEYHEGEKLSAMVEWLAPRFQNIEICVNDTLQRFNEMFENGTDESAARALTQTAGQDWAMRNSTLLAEISQLTITHWDQWLSDARFLETRRQIDSLYADNQEFQQAINGNIQAIWERRKSYAPAKYTTNRFLPFVDLSRQYLLEEISVFSLMYESKTALDVYPGTTIFAALVFQGRAVPAAPPGLGKGHFCRIDFSRNKNIDLKAPKLRPHASA